MEILTLDWDTKLFGYLVGKVVVQNSLLDQDLLLNNDFRLIYLFSNKKISKELVNKHNLFLADEKIDLITNVSALNFDRFPNDNFVELSEIDDILLDLTFQSGHYSRFKIDPNFKEKEFEKLYSIWIEKSISNKIAEKVIGFLVDKKLVGFVTICLNDNAYDIGLIAVDESHRNLKIGKQLLSYVFNYAIRNKIEIVTVTTQKQNHGALKFYINHGFSINKTNYIYHLWK